MATIASSLALKDKFTNTINRAVQGTNRLLKAMDAVGASKLDINLQRQLKVARDAVQATEKELEKLVQKMERADNASSRMMTGIKGMIASLAAGFTVKFVVEQTDLYASNQARLGLINDGLQTQAELQQKIYAAAQRSRGEYNAMVDSVAKLGLLAGDAFGSNNEMVAFAEQLNKAFTISGATTEQRNAAMLQLTQAMAAGKLQGDEYVSIMENAPMVIDAISKYTGKTKGELKELSSEGYITADIIKNALFAASDDINTKFEQMPKTFGSVWTQIANFSTMKFGGLMERINGFLNSSTGAAMVSGITAGIALIADGITWIIDLVQMGGDFVAQNWGIIQPVLMGITAALLFWGATLIPGMIAKLWAMAPALWAQIPPVMAQAAAWLAVHWPILAVGIAIAGVGLILNHFGITADQVIGFVVGLFYGLGAAVWNVVALMVNPFIMFAEFISNVFSHPLYSAKKLFVDFASGVLNILADLAGAIDWVFGSNLADAVTGWQAGLTDWLGEMPEGYKVLDKMEHLDIGDFGKKGYTAGSDFANGIKSGAAGLFGGVFGNDDPFGIGGIGTTGDFASTMKAPDIGKVGEVGKINSDVNIADEDLQLMKDVAEMRYVQNFVTLTPTVAMNARVSERVDIDELTGRVADALIEEVAAGAEGIYA